MLGPPLSAAEANLFENSVIPRYLAYFGALTAEMLLPSPQAQVAHIGCRTGYPDAAMLDKVPDGSFFGVDNSAPAIELARGRAMRTTGMRATYDLGETIPTALPDANF